MCFYPKENPLCSERVTEVFWSCFCSLAVRLQANPIFLQMELHGRFCFFPPLFLSFLIFTRTLISISPHPAGQCYLLFCFLPIIDSPLQNRLQLLLEGFFPLGTQKIFIKSKCLVGLSAGPFSAEVQARPGWKFQALFPENVLTTESGVHFTHSLQLR